MRKRVQGGRIKHLHPFKDICWLRRTKRWTLQGKKIKVDLGYSNRLSSNRSVKVSKKFFQSWASNFYFSGMRLKSSMAVEIFLCTKLMKVGHSLRVLSLQQSSETINQYPVFWNPDKFFIYLFPAFNRSRGFGRFQKPPCPKSNNRNKTSDDRFSFGKLNKRRQLSFLSYSIRHSFH